MCNSFEQVQFVYLFISIFFAATIAFGHQTSPSLVFECGLGTGDSPGELPGLKPWFGAHRWSFLF